MLQKYGILIILGLVGLYYAGRYFYMKPKFDNGNAAPQFTTTKTLSGDKIALADFKGQYVLLDFWGTWCGPCRAEMPHLRDLNEKYSGKTFKNAADFQIVSIALEKEGTESRWQKAISTLKLNWQNHIFDGVSNFRFLDAKIASDIYGVKEVPTKYFINPGGFVIGVNMPMADIEKILQDDLK